MSKIFLFHIFNLLSLLAVSQTTKNYSEAIPRQRLTAKQVKELIRINDGKLDKEFSEDYLNDTYLLKNGKVIVFFDTHGYLYDSFSKLREWIAYLDSSVKECPVNHILKDRLLYGHKYLSHLEELINKVVTFFKLENHIPSLSGLTL